MSRDTTALASGAWAQEVGPWGAQSSRCLVLKGKAAGVGEGATPLWGSWNPLWGESLLCRSWTVWWTADQLSPHPSWGLRQRAGSWRSPDS